MLKLLLLKRGYSEMEFWVRSYITRGEVSCEWFQYYFINFQRLRAAQTLNNMINLPGPNISETPASYKKS